MSPNASNETHQKLILAYEGTSFLGWQKTRMGNSIQAELEKALLILYKQPVEILAASRTDSGVHAQGQVVLLKTSKSVTLAQLNALLPKEIVGMSLEEVPAGFHPSLDAKSKVYHYHICNNQTQLPQKRLYSWHFPYPINIESMQAAVSLLMGKKDFKALANKKKNEVYADTIREVQEITIEVLPEKGLRVVIRADRFLYNMARNIVGLLLQVGRGKIPLEDIDGFLKGTKRLNIGITAPAKGLTLFKIFY